MRLSQWSKILLLRADSVLLDEPKQRFTEIIMTTISSGLTARQGTAGQSWGRELVVICKRWRVAYTAWRIEHPSWIRTVRAESIKCRHSPYDCRCNPRSCFRKQSIPNHASNRRGFFANFFEALHETRRCQAMREIHRYRHLIHYDNDYPVGFESR